MRTLMLTSLVLAMATSVNAQILNGAAPAPRSVQCVAAFELMQRAAPNWATQVSVQHAWTAWSQQAAQLSQTGGVDYGTQVNREMTDLAERLPNEAQLLSSRAMQCVADAPVGPRPRLRR